MVLTSTPREKAQFIEQAAVQGRSLWDDARARLMRNKAAVTGLVILAVLVFLAFIGPLL